VPLGNVKNPVTINLVSELKAGPKPYVEVEINGNKLRSLWDSGSPYTLMNSAKFKELKISQEIKKFPVKLVTANNSQIGIIGWTFLQLLICTTVINHPVP